MEGLTTPEWLKILAALGTLFSALGGIALKILRVLREEFQESRDSSEKISDQHRETFTKHVDQLVELHKESSAAEREENARNRDAFTKGLEDVRRSQEIVVQMHNDYKGKVA